MTRPVRRSKAGGFTLIEIVVVLLIVGIMLAMAAAVTRGVAAAQKRSLTSTRMAAVDAALVQFVQQKRRLPCPADGKKSSADNTAGLEGARNAGGCTGNEQDGVLPWIDLGLSAADITDGWVRRLTYRLQPALGGDGGMDMSWCDPAGTEVGGTPRACNTACTTAAIASCTPPSDSLATKGLTVKNVAGVTLMQPAPAGIAAAYVLISHGETGGGAYLGSGALATSTVDVDGDEEKKNYANLPYAAGNYYVDDTPMEASGASHFDDIVSRPSLMSVISKAGLGPRPH